MRWSVHGRAIEPFGALVLSWGVSVAFGVRRKRRRRRGADCGCDVTIPVSTTIIIVVITAAVVARYLYYYGCCCCYYWNRMEKGFFRQARRLCPFSPLLCLPPRHQLTVVGLA